MTFDLHHDGAAALRRSGVLDGLEWTLAVRPRRRSIGLQVKPGGQVVIAVPPQAGADAVVDFVTSKRDWVRRHVAEEYRESQEGQAARRAVVLADGQTFQFLGNSYALELTETPRADWADWKAGRLTLPRHLAATRGAQTIIDAYISRGMVWVHKRAPLWFDRLGLSGVAPRLYVRDVGKTRMGVYRPRHHRVDLHWRVLQLDEDLAELVLVHELVHATRPVGTSHGPEWRRRMDRALPGWRRLQRRVRKLDGDLWTGSVSGPGA